MSESIFALTAAIWAELTGVLAVALGGLISRAVWRRFKKSNPQPW